MDVERILPCGSVIHYQMSCTLWGLLASTLWGVEHIRRVFKKDQKRDRKRRGCLMSPVATWAVPHVILVLLRVSGDATLEAVLPELGEPWVAGVGAELELEEVLIKGGDLVGLQFDRDAARGLVFVSLYHLNSVRPAITEERTAHLVKLHLKVQFFASCSLLEYFHFVLLHYMLYFYFPTCIRCVIEQIKDCKDFWG